MNDLRNIDINRIVSNYYDINPSAYVDGGQYIPSMQIYNHRFSRSIIEILAEMHPTHNPLNNDIYSTHPYQSQSQPIHCDNLYRVPTNNHYYPPNHQNYFPNENVNFVYSNRSIYNPNNSQIPNYPINYPPNHQGNQYPTNNMMYKPYTSNQNSNQTYNGPQRNQDYNVPQRNQDYNVPQRNQDYNVPQRNQDYNVPQKNNEMYNPQNPQMPQRNFDYNSPYRNQEYNNAQYKSTSSLLKSEDILVFTYNDQTLINHFVSLFQPLYNLTIKKNLYESSSKVELYENNVKKFEYTVSSVQQIDRIHAFLTPTFSYPPTRTHVLHTQLSNLQSESNFVFEKPAEKVSAQGNAKKPKRNISENKAQSLKQTVSGLLSSNKVTNEEYEHILTMIDEDNPTLNTIINFFRVNFDEDELVANLRMVLSEGRGSSINQRPYTTNPDVANNSQTQRNLRPATSKVNFFETDSDFESDIKEMESTVKKDQNRFFAIMDEIENKNLIDEGEKIGVLKTLILEENRNIFKLIENYAEGNFNLIELARKLELIAKQKLEFFIERPKTPNERKSELFLKLNNLFSDQLLSDTEVNVLHRLIEEENEFVISAFDVYESDSNLKELVDTLKKIVQKAMRQKVNIQNNISQLVPRQEEEEHKHKDKTQASLHATHLKESFMRPDHAKERNSTNHTNLSEFDLNKDSEQPIHSYIKMPDKMSKKESSQYNYYNPGESKNKQEKQQPSDNTNELGQNRLNTNELGQNRLNTNELGQNRLNTNELGQNRLNTETSSVRRPTTSSGRKNSGDLESLKYQNDELQKFLSWMVEHENTAVELVELVRNDRQWTRMLQSSIENYGSDYYELLHELKFWIIQKCLLVMSSHEEYSRRIDESKMDKDSIINYIIQDYNEFPDQWTTAIIQVLKGHSCQGMWDLTNENIIKGRKIKNSIYINKKLNKDKGHVDKHKRTHKVLRSQPSREFDQDGNNIILAEEKKEPEMNKPSPQSDEKKILEKIRTFANNNFENWQMKYFEKIITQKLEPNFSYFKNAIYDYDKLAAISYEKISKFVENYFNKQSNDLLMDVIKYNYDTGPLIDLLVNDREDIELVGFLYERLTENIDTFPEISTDFYEMNNRQYNETIMDPITDGMKIDEIIKMAIEGLNTQEERDFITNYLSEHEEAQKLVDSCASAFKKNSNLADVVQILTLTYNLSKRRYSFVQFDPEPEFDALLTQLENSNKLTSDEIKYIRLKLYTGDEKLNQAYREFCRTSDFEGFHEKIAKFILANSMEILATLREWEVGVPNGLGHDADWVYQLPEFLLLEQNMDRDIFNTLKRVISEHCVEDIFLALVDVYRCDKNMEEFTEGIDIMINKLEDTHAQYDHKYDFKTIHEIVTIYKQKFTSNQK